MPGASNIQQWNPGAANQKSDADYTADTQRTGGLPTGQATPSATANKAFFQWSTVLAAFAAALATKGYTISDANLSSLTTVLGNIMTQSDMSPYALTSAVTALLSTTVVAAQNGYIKLPAVLGGIIIQWCVGTGVPANTNNSQTVSWPLTFPNNCFWASVSTRISDANDLYDCLWQTVGAPTVTGQQVQLAHVNNELSGNNTYPCLLAIGN